MIGLCVSITREVILASVKRVTIGTPPTTALSKTSSFLEKSTLEIQEAATFEFEPLCQALRFGSWKISFRGEVMSGSSHPKLQKLQNSDLYL